MVLDLDDTLAPLHAQILPAYDALRQFMQQHMPKTFEVADMVTMRHEMEL